MFLGDLDNRWLNVDSTDVGLLEIVVDKGW
jgi:hypothetical protein